MVVFYVSSNPNPTCFANIYSLLEDYRKLITFLDNPPIKLIYREANGVVNWSIRNYYNFCNDLIICDHPLKGVVMNLLNNLNFFSYPKKKKNNKTPNRYILIINCMSIWVKI